MRRGVFTAVDSLWRNHIYFMVKKSFWPDSPVVHKTQTQLKTGSFCYKFKTTVSWINVRILIHYFLQILKHYAIYIHLAYR